MKGRFPIRFHEIPSLKEYDETEHYIQSLDKLTSFIGEIHKEANKSPRALQKDMCEFLCLLGARGFLTCLGVRRTIGSQESVLPPEREELVEMLNRLNKPLTEEELRFNPNPSLLTVGGRAIQKHASRSPGIWIDKQTMNGMTESEKNAKAQEVIGRIIQTCQWINIHTLHQGTPLVFILEIRDSLGFGARWEIQGQFRGLIEPQLQYMNQKKNQ